MSSSMPTVVTLNLFGNRIRRPPRTRNFSGNIVCHALFLFLLFFTWNLSNELSSQSCISISFPFSLLLSPLPSSFLCLLFILPLSSCLFLFLSSSAPPLFTLSHLITHYENVKFSGFMV